MMNKKHSSLCFFKEDVTVLPVFLLSGVISLYLALALTGCSSSPHRAESLDLDLKNAEKVSTDTELGVKQGLTVVQRKTSMAEELRRVKIQAHDLEASVYGGPRYFGNRGLYGVLKECLMERARPENGGEGKLQPMPEERNYVISDEQESKIGLDDKGRVVGLSDEYLKDALDRYRDAIRILTTRESDYTDRISMCKLGLSQAAKK
jgi:hypothetical protein